MSSKQFRRQHEDWKFMPAFLSKSQRQNPMNTICWFCGWFTLHEARFFLMDILRTAMGSEDWQDDDPDDKARKLLIIQELIDLIEGAYLIDEMLKEGLFSYSIKARKE